MALIWVNVELTFHRPKPRKPARLSKDYSPHVDASLGLPQV